MAITRQPYPGSSRKLVVAVDVGTTCSGVSYAFLDPGVVPEFRSVVRFLDNGMIGASKIPSDMFYDHDGSFRGVKGTVDDDEAEDLHQVRWWKLGVSPGGLPTTAKKHIAVDLPKDKSLRDVFTDFIRYLFNSAKAFIQECEPMGKGLWESLGSNIDLILSHPNGWEGREQAFLRKSVVRAGILTEEEALSRVSFVTEGEATFNFCVMKTNSSESLKPGNKVVVIDAGGGTIDISSYTVTSTSPLKVEEFHEPKCFYQGAEIVTARARGYAEAMFKGTKFDNKNDLETFTRAFDTKLKTTFSDSSKPQFVKFGLTRDTDTRAGVSNGRMGLPGNEVQKFFEPAVDTIVKCVKEITVGIDPTNTFVFLAGGFGASPWIFKEVGREIADQGLRLSRPDTFTSKAVADGAISYYLDQFVVGRVVRCTYGTPVSIKYDPSDPEHCRRSHEKYQGVSGLRLDVFHPTLFKGTRVSGTREFRDEITGISLLSPAFRKPAEFPVIRYTGTSKNPKWMDEDRENFKTLSRIFVDVTKAPCFPGLSPRGLLTFVQEFKVIYIYGQTEFKAQVSWMEGGIEKRSDAVVLYDDEENAQGT